MEKDITAIQVLKILYKQSSHRKIKKTHSKKVYPIAIENSYRKLLQSFYEPLITYVNSIIEENKEPLLRGDSVKLDAIPGGTFQRMIQQLEGWLSTYMPTVEELKDGQNNVILMGLGTTSEKIKKHEEKQFNTQIEKGIGVTFTGEQKWWEPLKKIWEQNNYNLIVSNARNFVDKINAICENGITGGWSVKQLKDAIKKATIDLDDKKCRLLARDQIGKLQGQITQAQMTEVGLEMYIWSTSGDERVRSSHIPLDGVLCRWDDSTLCSFDNGKTWVSRPSTATRVHPGQDIQCRCVALVYYPELVKEVSNTDETVEQIAENIAPVVPAVDNIIDENKVFDNEDFRKIYGDKFVDDFLIPMQKNFDEEVTKEQIKSIVVNAKVRDGFIDRSFTILRDEGLLGKEFDNFDFTKLTEKDVKKLVDNLNKNIVKRINETVPVIRMGSSTFRTYLVKEQDKFFLDPRLKSQFETGASADLFDKNRRSRWEYKLNYEKKYFTNFFSSDSKNKKLRPVYGTMFNKSEVEKMLQLNEIYNYKENYLGSSEQYGNVFFVLKNNKVKNRSTFTLENSSACQGGFTNKITKFLFQFLDEPGFQSVVRDSSYDIKYFFPKGLKGIAEERKNYPFYLETQIWGGVNIFEDVEKIIVPKTVTIQDGFDDFRKKLKEKGVEIVVKDIQ